jgi:DNA-binding winged helix-turn-helix (wHTH) protein
MKEPALDTPLPQPYALGEWLVLPSLDRLERDGETVRLEPKWMDTLNVLAARSGEVIGRNQLLREVWGGSFVAESTLSRTIAELRRCLGDDAHQPRYIETIPRRGYRLLQPATPSAGEAPPVSEPPLPPSQPSPWLGFLAGAVCCGLVVAAVRATRPRPPSGERRGRSRAG